MIPDLSNETEMAREGRLSRLYRARAKTSEQARDMAARMLNHIEDSALWEIDKLADLFREIEELNLMIAEHKEAP
jgi:sugar-specific transcriptional regulator TrmB